MKNSRSESAFLELLRCGVWNKEPDLGFFTSLTQFDWLQIYMLSGKQTVLGLCFKTVMKLPDNLKPPVKVLLQWVGVSRYIEACNNKMSAVLKELQQRFHDENIETVLLKGLSISRWYAFPLARQASDIDLYIPHDFERAVDVVKGWGFECRHKKQHDSFVYNGITVELHHDVVTTPYKLNISYEIIEDYIGDVKVKVLDANASCILLLTHAAGHFLIPGIGYRYLCDWASFLKNNYSKIDVEAVQKELRRIGVHRFAIEFTELARVELGLDFPGIDQWNNGTKSKYRDRLAKELLAQGDFGAVNFQKDYGGNRVAFAKDLIRSLLRSRYYWPRLFWRRVPRFIFKLIKGYCSGLFSCKAGSCNKA